MDLYHLVAKIKQTKQDVRFKLLNSGPPFVLLVPGRKWSLQLQSQAEKGQDQIISVKIGRENKIILEDYIKDD